MFNIKRLLEKREQNKQRMDAIVKKADEEVRALSAEEAQEFDDLEEEIRAIDSTIEKAKKAQELVADPEPGTEESAKEQSEEQRAEADKHAFENYIRGIVEERADSNMTMTDGAAVIPTSIANKIIAEVVDICPIYKMSDRYNVKGNLSIPVYDESEGKIEMTYSDEFSELESTSGKMKSVNLKEFLAGVLTKVSKSLINNSNFNITDFVATRMAKSIAIWIENELLNGTEGKIEGLSTCENVITAAAATVVTTDELIDVQEAVPDKYQSNAIWIMNKATRTAIRKLKDAEGNYILNKDATSKWGYTLFGKDVYTSQNMSKMEAGKKAVYYGDMTGLATKVSEDINIEVLREKFATQHAIGVVGWVELDAKIQNKQKISCLEMPA